MRRLFQFVYRYRAFFLFVFLESLSAWFIVNNNQYQKGLMFNSSNKIIASVLSLSNDVKSFFSLREKNRDIARENTRLKNILIRRNRSFYTLEISEMPLGASTNQFTYISAKVVNNSVHRFKNYITIDKGSKDGVKTNMGVVGQRGAVGKVKAVSQHYSVVASLLNTGGYLSCIIKNTHHFGSVRWDGADPSHVQLNFIPRHAKPLIGDSVVTSGFNAIFPKGVQIGVISSVHLDEYAKFYDLQVELAQDFTRLGFVHVIANSLKMEKDSLERHTAINP